MASSSMEEGGVEVEHSLVPCTICGRTFLPGPLKKHSRVCERNATRKRRVFDSLKQRVEGTELAAFHQPSFLRRPEPASSPPAAPPAEPRPAKWKEKHEEFVQAIRAAKGAPAMGPRRSISSVGTMGTTERCPSCDRQFGPKSFDRHVEWCKEHKTRVVRSPANVLVAKERLEARTKYRVPPLNKSKRSVTRDKYAPLAAGSRSESVVSVRSAGSVERTTKVPAAKPPTPEPTKSVHARHRTPRPKINTADINGSVLDMTVSQVTPTHLLASTNKLTTWRDSTNQQAKANTQLDEQSDTECYALKPAASTLDMSIPNAVRKKDSCEIVTIKEPPLDDGMCDTDSLYSEPETKWPATKFILDRTISLVDSSANVECKSGPRDEKESLEFLNSLKFKSNSSEMFSAELKSKYTSTPLQDKYTSSDPGACVMRCGKSPSDRDAFCTYETSPIFNFHERSLSPNRTPSLEGNLSACFTDVSSKGPGNLSAKDASMQVAEIITQHDDVPLPDVSVSEHAVIPHLVPDTAGGRHRCNIEDLDRFLTTQSKECQLEIEIIASETNDEQNIPSLNLYRENSSEIVVEGQNCLDTLNKLLLRNEIKTVNIIFINEDVSKHEPNEKNNPIIKETKRLPKRLARPKKTSYLKYLNKRKKNRVVYIPRDHVAKDDTRLLCLPFIPPSVSKSRNDHFWEKQAESNPSCPLMIDKSVIHERAPVQCNERLRRTNAKLSPVGAAHGEWDDVGWTTPRSLVTRTPRDIVESMHHSKDEYNPFVVAERQLMELLECDDFKPYTATPKSASKSPVQSSKLSKHKSAPKSTQAKRASVIDPPDGFQDKLNLLQDNFEIIENFINDNFVSNPDDAVIDNGNVVAKRRDSKSTANNNNKHVSNEGLSLNSILSERKYSDDINSIDPSLINETDNLSIPEKLSVDNYSPVSGTHDLDHYSVQYDRKISALEPLVLAKTEVSLSRSMSLQDEQQPRLDEIDFDEFISSFEDDESFPALKSFLHNSKAADLVEKKAIQKSTVSLHSSFGKSSPAKSTDARKPLSPLKRSISLSNPVVKARSMKNKQDIQDYLHVKEPKAPAARREKLKPVSQKSSEELFPPDHEMYEDYQKYKALYRREQAGSGDEASSAEEAPPAARKPQVAGKMSGDSAYGRKSSKVPAVAVSTAARRASVERSPSSSGSETSLLSAPAKANSTPQRLSKFCHECGTKYPLNTAKFCIECGVRRLVL